VKFPSVQAFEKHLKEAVPEQFFLIVSPAEYERQKVYDKIGAILHPSRTVRLNGLEASIAQVKEELFSPSLWGGVTLVIFDYVDKVKNLVELFAHLPPETHLIVGAGSFKPVSELYQKGKKEIVALDLSDEKPWEKERRLQEWLISRVKEEKRTLSHESAVFLVQTLGADLAVLDQELAKLLCYVGEKEKIELTDVKAICGTRDLTTGWQLSEKFVWDRPISLKGKASDLGFILPFIGQLRYQFQLGLEIAELIEKKTPMTDMKHHFPTVRQLDKYIGIAKTRKPLFFSRGLQALYELEFSSKSSGVDTDVLFDLFQGKVYEKALSSSKSAP
jgi:DNA polymerase-3 subunit delta